MQRMKKRANGKGSAIFLGNGRYRPWGARISLGKNEKGEYIYHFIDTFETELEALVCLENYHKQPYSLYISEEKYNKIITFPRKPYPIIAVRNPRNEILKDTKKNTYTLKQLFEEYKELKFPTAEEGQYERHYHIRAKGKISYNLLLFITA